MQETAQVSLKSIALINYQARAARREGGQGGQDPTWPPAVRRRMVEGIAESDFRRLIQNLLRRTPPLQLTQRWVCRCSAHLRLPVLR